MRRGASSTCGWGKLNVFRLPLRRVAYLDIDSLALRNLSPLFARTDASFRAVPEGPYGCGTHPKCIARYSRGDEFNSGVMAFSPSAGLFERMVGDDRLFTAGGSDQDFLNRFFADAFANRTSSARLDRAYNMHASQFPMNEVRTKVLHFSGNDKPWAFQQKGRGIKASLRVRKNINPRALRAFDEALRVSLALCERTPARAKERTQTTSTSCSMADSKLRHLARVACRPLHGRCLPPSLVRNLSMYEVQPCAAWDSAVRMNEGA